MIINRIEEIEITDLEKKFNLELHVSERLKKDKYGERYYAFFKGCDIEDGVMLMGICGNGGTIDEALSDYASHLTGRTLVINSLTDQESKFKCPRIVHTKSSNLSQL